MLSVKKKEEKKGYRHAQIQISLFHIYQQITIGPHHIAHHYPASREMLDRRWANVVTYVGAMSANDVGPMWICPSVQRWHNVVTPPTMTLCQRFANVITYCILLYFMVGTTFAHCLYEWLAKHWHNFIIAHCLSTITIEITSFI